MMTSAPQPFPHGGMPGHAGMPHGHPMGPGHPSGQGIPTAGQPGVSMAQPMHGMGGNPQVSQGGPMVGMPQGGGPGVSMGGPSAHALSHLNPSAHPQMQYQQQQQQLAQCEYFHFLSIYHAPSAQFLSHTGNALATTRSGRLAMSELRRVVSMQHLLAVDHGAVPTRGV
jgi:hypothetical protein